MNPFVAVVRILFDSLLACIQYILIMLLISYLMLIAIDTIKSKVFHIAEEENNSKKPIIVLTLLQMLILFIIMFPGKYEEYTSPSYSRTKIAERYERNYPMTWAYISEHSDEPYDYIVYYDKVWGDLQKYNGDGIVFDTLSPYEQSKVHYPDIGQYIYYTSGSHTYHSTTLCYSLLRSDPFRCSSKYAYLYEPCSKCVGE